MQKFFLLSPFAFNILAGIVSLLLVLSIVFYSLKALKGDSKFVGELIARTNSWWIIVGLISLILFIHPVVAYLGTAILAYFAFRELSGQAQLRKADRRILLWCLLNIPVQWAFAYINYYNGFVIWIPVVGFIFVTFLLVTTEDTEQVSRSMGLIHWITMATFFSFSHLPYFLNYPWHDSIDARPTQGADLLLFLLIMTEANDVFQFTWGKIFGKHKIIPKVSPNKTVEGFVGGFLSSLALGWLLQDLVGLSIDKVLVLSGFMAFVGFMGDVTFSAIKRELQIKDMSNLIPGHGGILDRADSLAFTSIFFFHLFRFWNQA